MRLEVDSDFGNHRLRKQTPLLLAAERGHLGAFTCLLEGGGERLGALLETATAKAARAAQLAAVAAEAVSDAVDVVTEVDGKKKHAHFAKYLSSKVLEKKEKGLSDDVPKAIAFSKGVERGGAFANELQDFIVGEALLPKDYDEILDKAAPDLKSQSIVSSLGQTMGLTSRPDAHYAPFRGEFRAKTVHPKDRGVEWKKVDKKDEGILRRNIKKAKDATHNAAKRAGRRRAAYAAFCACEAEGLALEATDKMEKLDPLQSDDSFLAAQRIRCVKAACFAVEATAAALSMTKAQEANQGELLDAQVLDTLDELQDHKDGGEEGLWRTAERAVKAAKAADMADQMKSTAEADAAKKERSAQEYQRSQGKPPAQKAPVPPQVVEAEAAAAKLQREAAQHVEKVSEAVTKAAICLLATFRYAGDKAPTASRLVEMYVDERCDAEVEKEPETVSDKEHASEELKDVPLLLYFPEKRSINQSKGYAACYAACCVEKYAAGTFSKGSYNVTPLAGQWATWKDGKRMVDWHDVQVGRRRFVETRTRTLLAKAALGKVTKKEKDTVEMTSQLGGVERKAAWQRGSSSGVDGADANDRYPAPSSYTYGDAKGGGGSGGGGGGGGDCFHAVMRSDRMIEEDPLYVTAREMGHTELLRAMSEWAASEVGRVDLLRSELYAIAEKAIAADRSSQENSAMSPIRRRQSSVGEA